MPLSVAVRECRLRSWLRLHQLDYRNPVELLAVLFTSICAALSVAVPLTLLIPKYWQSQSPFKSPPISWRKVPDWEPWALAVRATTEITGVCEVPVRQADRHSETTQVDRHSENDAGRQRNRLGEKYKRPLNLFISLSLSPPPSLSYLNTAPS